jgi:signal transduction histidine kinase
MTMKLIRSLRVRFAIWTTVLILLLLAAFGTFVYFNLSRSLTSAVDDSLAVSAAQVFSGLNIQDGRVIIPEALSPEDSGILALSERGLTVVVLAKDGNLLQSVGPYRDVTIDITGILPGNVQGKYLTLVDRVKENDPLRAYLLPVLDNGQVAGWVQVIQSLGPVQDALNQLLTALLLGGAALLLFAALGGYFLSARALKPIDRITQTAQQIAGGEDLSARLNLPDNGDEVSRLAATLDAMLVRLDDAFHRERQFTADASHELRTPLAAMQAILGVIREGERPVGEYRQALDDLNEETNRLRGLVEDLLHLVRGEASADLASESVSLSNILIDVADSLRPLAEAKGLALIVQVPENLNLTGDTDALIRLFVNLIDNAIKYTERGKITVVARNAQNVIEVDVIDTGIGILPQHQVYIFDRFYRVDLARSSGGAGLGLAIARQIARTHHGRLDVQSEPGVGSTFTVYLPI